jgi:hypothetical protein
VEKAVAEPTVHAVTAYLGSTDQLCLHCWLKKVGALNHRFAIRVDDNDEAVAIDEAEPSVCGAILQTSLSSNAGEQDNLPANTFNHTAQHSVYTGIFDLHNNRASRLRAGRPSRAAVGFREGPSVPWVSTMGSIADTRNCVSGRRLGTRWGVYPPSIRGRLYHSDWPKLGMSIAMRRASSDAM